MHWLQLKYTAAILFTYHQQCISHLAEHDIENKQLVVSGEMNIVYLIESCCQFIQMNVFTVFYYHGVVNI